MTERFKGAAHFGTGCLVSALALYNVGEACSPRREWRHVVNSSLYLAFVGWEAAMTLHHWRQVR